MRRAYLACLTIVTVFCIILGSIIHLGRGSEDMEDSYAPAEEPMSFDEMGGEVGQLAIYLSAGSVNIAIGDGYEIYGSNTDGIDWYIDGDTLFVTGATDGVDQNNPTVVNLTLPEYISLRYVSAELALGNITMEGVNTESTYINCEQGNATVSNSYLGDATVEVNTGNALLEDVDFTHLNVTCTVGNADISTRTALSDYDMELTTSRGKITVAGEEKGRNGRYTQRAEYGLTLRVESEAGNISVQ